MKKNHIEIEIWADSFKEGEFLLERLSKAFKQGKISYEHGFQPVITISYQKNEIKFIVYGYYSSWNNIPVKISNLLKFGKPDGIIYDPSNDNIILAYEETAAVPTGNQSQQRLERVWYAAKEKIPFVYLLGKYGLHIDGGIRTNSIWPSYLGLKLSSQYCVPSLTMLYGSKNEPENYKIGDSLEKLEIVIKWFIIKKIFGIGKNSEIEKILIRIYKQMCDFIISHYKEISGQLPGIKIMQKKEFHCYLTNRFLTNVCSENMSSKFKWKLNQKKSQSPTTQSFDSFIIEIEKLVTKNHAWWPIKGSTVRTESLTNVKKWTSDQIKHKQKVEKIRKKTVSISFNESSFPNRNSKKIIGTSAKILVLIDSSKKFLNSLEKEFGVISRKKAEILLNEKIPLVFYVSSSLQSNGRAFKGDPFTGQITAYSRIFSIGLNGEKERNMVAYYPNQLYTQFFNKNFKKLDNKGVKSIQENVDLVITRDGVMIDPKTWRLL